MQKISSDKIKEMSKTERKKLLKIAKRKALLSEALSFLPRAAKALLSGKDISMTRHAATGILLRASLGEKSWESGIDEKALSLLSLMRAEDSSRESGLVPASEGLSIMAEREARAAAQKGPEKKTVHSHLH